MAAFSSSESWQVFIHCRGSVSLNRFISHLEGALDLAGIKYRGDTREVRSEDLRVHFAWIRQSKIALSIFSRNYAEATWCLDELVEIMEQVEKGKLIIIPVFFNVEPEEVREQKGEFGLKRYGEGRWKRSNIPKWEKALQSVPSKIGFNLKNYRNEWEFADSIVDSIKAEFFPIQRTKLMNKMACLAFLSRTFTNSRMDGPVKTPKKVLPLVPPPINRGVEHLKDAEFPTGTSYGDINKSSAAFSNINQHRPQHPSLHFDSSDAEEIDAVFFGSESRGGGNDSGTFTNSRMDDPFKTPKRVLPLVPPPVNKGVEHLKDTEFPTGKFGAKPQSTSYGDINNSSAASSYINQHRPQHVSLHFDSSDAEEIDAEFFGPESRGGNASGNELDSLDSIIDSTERVLAIVPPPVNRGEEHLKDTEFPTGTSYDDINNSSAASPSLHFDSSDAEEIDAEFFGSESRGGSNASGNIPEKRTFTNSRMDGPVKPPEIQDSNEINFRGEELRYGFVSHLIMALKSYRIRSQLGMKIGCLLVLFFCLQQIAYRSTRVIDHGSAIDRMVEYIPTDGTRDKDTEFPTCKVGANPDSSSSDAKTIAADFFDRTYTNSPMKVKPPKIQVFINFRGDQLHNNFVGYLVDALQRSEINVFIDKQAQRGEDLNTLFKRIEDSGIAIVVFSSRYTESKWCLEELVKIKERVHQGLLKVLPIFYKVTPTNVKRLKGEFGDHFRDKEYLYESDEARIKRWKEAIAYVSHKFALTLDEKSSTLEIDFVETVVTEVLKMLQAISKLESGENQAETQF